METGCCIVAGETQFGGEGSTGPNQIKRYLIDRRWPPRHRLGELGILPLKLEASINLRHRLSMPVQLASNICVDISTLASHVRLTLGVSGSEHRHLLISRHPKHTGQPRGNVPIPRANSNTSSRSLCSHARCRGRRARRNQMRSVPRTYYRRELPCY